MTTIILAGVLLLIAAILIYAATKPNVYPIERSILIKANPEKIFDYINNLKAWEVWTPYNQDAKGETLFSGPDSGPNAAFSWNSKGKAGKGSMEITKSIRPTMVAIDLRMIKPFLVVNKVEFLIDPQGDGTKVTWRMQHNEPYPAKVVGIFMSMDKMVGSDFEIGLARLKNTVEDEVAAIKATLEPYASRKGQIDGKHPGW
ncbi:MAG TPA: SRPBCC family protein [Chitinophagaceae bacterium]|jgi:hypothetical protein